MLITYAYILFAIAALMSAVMDRTGDIVAFNRSIFNHLSPKFWCKEVSWQYAYIIPFTKYKVDAWHLAKSSMVICLVACIVIMPVSAWYHFFLLGVTWNVVFNLSYNKLLKR